METNQAIADMYIWERAKHERLFGVITWLHLVSHVITLLHCNVTYGLPKKHLNPNLFHFPNELGKVNVI